MPVREAVGGIGSGGERQRVVRVQPVERRHPAVVQVVEDVGQRQRRAEHQQQLGGRRPTSRRPPRAGAARTRSPTSHATAEDRPAAAVKSACSAAVWRVRPGRRCASGPTIQAGKPCCAGPERNDGRSAAARPIAAHTPAATPSAAIPSSARSEICGSAPACARGRGTRIRDAAGVAAMRAGSAPPAVRRHSPALSARERRVGIVFGRRRPHGVGPLRDEARARAALDDVLDASARPRRATAHSSSTPSTGTPGATGSSRRAVARGERDHVGGLGAVAADEQVWRTRGGRRAAPTSGRSCVRQGRDAACGDAVDGVLRHAAVGRELAADDREHAGAGVLDQGVAAREVGGARGRAGHQRPQAGVAADDVARPSSGTSSAARARPAARVAPRRPDRAARRPAAPSCGSSVRPTSTSAVRARDGEREAPPAAAGQRDADRGARAHRGARRDEQVRAAAGAQGDRGLQARRPRRRWR